ncbi:MAG: hydrogenase maturation protease [Egibacteraceae bacterium]
MSGKTLVAGVGNIFLGDDAFGVEVAHRLARVELPEGVKVADFGIRSVHLAYELLDGYDTAILIDATPMGETPGTLFVIEPEVDATLKEAAVKKGETPLIDVHGLTPTEVFTLVQSLGGTIERLLIVGCEPAEITERIGLSETVQAVVEEAVRLVQELVQGSPDVQGGSPDEVVGNETTKGG